MRMAHKGLLLAALHVALVLSIAAKLLIDRNSLPRVWVEVTPVDPDAPIRGRYLSLRLEAVPRGFSADQRATGRFAAILEVQNNQLVAVASKDSTGTWVRFDALRAAPFVTVDEPVAYFIPEHIPDPSRRPREEVLWAEVTVPRNGPPRPIRLGVKKNGVLTPLDIH